MDMAVVASWLLSWALALSHQGSQHQQVIYADIRKSSLAKCTDFTPVVAVLGGRLYSPLSLYWKWMYPEVGGSRFFQNVGTCLIKLHGGTSATFMTIAMVVSYLKYITGWPKSTVFWDVAPCSLVDLSRSIRRDYRRRMQGRRISQGRAKLLAWRTLWTLKM
jgi:hypothetical protein